MVTGPNKKQEEVTPQEQSGVDQTPPAMQDMPVQPQGMISPYAMHMQELESIGAQQEALQAKADARQASIDELQRRINEAKAKQMSVFSAFVDSQKPKYDEKKEKRMRNRAMIMAFGDILAEASKGYFAYNKKGAGVVPKGTSSNALEEVNKISEMQKKYLEEKKAWDNLNMDWQAKRAQAEIDAAEALLTNEEKYQAKIEERIEKLRERGIKITDGIRDAIAEQVMKEYNMALEEESKRGHELWLRENRLGQYAPPKVRVGTPAAKEEKAEMDELVKIYGRLHGYGADGVTEWGDLLPSEQKGYYEIAPNDAATVVCKQLLNEGLLMGDAENIIQEVINSGQSIENLFYDWATSRTGYTLREYLEENIRNGLPVTR